MAAERWMQLIWSRESIFALTPRTQNPPSVSGSRAFLQKFVPNPLEIRRIFHLVEWVDEYYQSVARKDLSHVLHD